jgi:hypothetical protein
MKFFHQLEWHVIKDHNFSILWISSGDPIKIYERFPKNVVEDGVEGKIQIPCIFRE